MADKITLAVRFRMNEPAKLEFIAKLQEVFHAVAAEYDSSTKPFL
jgi:hypothetical protein